MEKQKTDLLLKELLNRSWEIEESVEILLSQGQKNILELIQHIAEFNYKTQGLRSKVKVHTGRFKMFIKNLESSDRENFFYFLNHVEPRINDLEEQLNRFENELEKAFNTLSEIAQSVDKPLKQIHYKNPL